MKHQVLSLRARVLPRAAAQDDSCKDALVILWVSVLCDAEEPAFPLTRHAQPETLSSLNYNHYMSQSKTIRLTETVKAAG